MVQATEQYWKAQAKDLELQVQELQLQLKSLIELEKARELALQKALEWDLG
jgi:hypothetical protein